MSGNTARAQASSNPWPPGVSHIPSMSIGAALSILKSEFPAVTLSKIRFLEDQELVSPHRTHSGYRTYSAADVERLRFVLAAQRDSFLPLKVIRERLAELDAGASQAPTPGARVVSEDGELIVNEERSRYTAEQLAHECGQTPEQIQELVAGGLLVADAGGKFPAALVPVAKAAAELAEHGIEARHLRALRTAAERQVDIISQVIAPVASVRSGPSSAGARAKAQSMAGDLAESFATLHTALVRAGTDRLV